MVDWTRVVAVEFGKYILTLRLRGLPKGLDPDARERVMIKDDLQGFGLSIRKDLGANT